MEENYTVSFKIHDTKATSNGGWSNSFVAQYSDYWQAVAKFGSEVNRLINVQDYDFVLVLLADTFGVKRESIFRDSRVAPEPEPNE